jgi:hypothetical protein
MSGQPDTIFEVVKKGNVSTNESMSMRSLNEYMQLGEKLSKNDNKHSWTG